MLDIIPIRLAPMPNNMVRPMVINTSQINGRKQNGKNGILINLPKTFLPSINRRTFWRLQWISAIMKQAVITAQTIATRLNHNITSSLFYLEFAFQEKQSQNCFSQEDFLVLRCVFLDSDCRFQQFVLVNGNVHLFFQSDCGFDEFHKRLLR